MSRPVLVLGFGPFRDVVDNPAARLARAVDGVRVEGRPVVGEEMPVSYLRGPQSSVARIRQLDPVLVVGLGVANSRADVCVERLGRWVGADTQADVDGACWRPDPTESAPPAVVEATLDVVAMAEALDARVSDDAGDYVCNAWLYRVVRAVGGDLPVGFVHLPPRGMTPDRLLRGLAALLAPTAVVG